MEAAIRRALDFVTAQQATYADIRLERGHATTIDLRDGVFRELSYGIDEGMGVRVLFKDSWGFASSNDPAQPAVQATFENALSTARALSHSKSGKHAAALRLADAPVTTEEFTLKPRINPEDVSIEAKKRLVKEAYDAAKGHSEHVTSVSVIYLDGFEEQIIATTEGSYIVLQQPAVFLRASVVAKRGTVLQEGRESVGAVAGFEFIEAEDPTMIAVKAADKAVRLLDAELPPAGELPVIMDNRLTGVFMHEALGHAAEADHVLYGESILKGKVGAAIAYEGLTVADDPTIEASHGYYRYDDEGLRARRTELIKDGVLVSYLHSRETAGRLDAAPTANARAEDYSEIPVVRMSNTVIEPGGWQFDELRADIAFGIYAKGMRGGQVDTVKGEFQFSAEEAFLIENGTFTKRLKNVALSGRTLDVLKNIDAIGTEKKRGTIGFCGKAGQDVPVSEYAPHVRVTKILVGGSSSG